MKSSTAPRVFPSRPSSGGGGGGGSSSGDRPPSLTQRDRERQRELERSARAAAAATLASGLPLVPTDPVAGPEHHLHHHSLPVFGAPTHTTEEDESSRLIKSVLGDFTDFAQTVLKSHASTDHPSALGISSREVKVRKVEQIFNEMKKPFGEPISGLDDLDDGGGSNSSTNLTPRLPPPLPFSSKFASSYSSGSLSSGPALTSAPPPPLGPSLGASSNTHLSQQPPAAPSTTLAATTIPNRKSQHVDHHSSAITNLHPHPLLQSSLPQTTAASDDPSPPPSHHQTPPTIKVVDATHLSSPFSDSVKKRKLTPTPPPPSSFEAPSSRSAAATTNTLHSQPAAAAASATQSQTNSRRSHGHRQRKSTTDQSDSSPSDGSSSSSSSSAESEGEDGEESSASSVESGEIDGEEASDKASVASQSTVGKATSTLNGCWDLDNFIESTKPEKRESSKERDKERDKEKSSSGSNSTKKGTTEGASGVGSSSKYSRDTQNLSSNHQDLTATLHEYVNRNSASLGPKGPGSKASTTTSQAKSQPVNSLHDAPDAKPAHLTNGTSSTASSTPPSFIVSLSLNRLNRIPCVDRNGNVAHAQNGHGTEKSSKSGSNKASSGVVSGSTEKDSHLNEENCPPLSSALSCNSKKDKTVSKKTAREESGTGESPAKRPKGESVASSKGTREAREAIKKERDKETITTTGSKRDREKDRGEEKAPKSLMANIPLTSIKSKKGGGGATLPEEKVSTPRSSSKEKHKETPGKKERTGTGGAKETSKERGSTTVDGLKSLKSRNASGTPPPSSTSLLAKASPMARSSPGVNLVASSIQPARDAPSSRDPLRPSATYTSRSLFDSSPLGIYHFLARYNPSMNEGESQANAKLLKRQADKQGECKQKQLTLYLEAVIYFIQMAMRIEGVRLDTDSAYHIYKDTLSLLKMTTQNFIKSPQTRLSGESCSVQDIKLAILAYRCQAALMLKLNRMRSKEMHENKELISGFMAQTSIQAVLSHGPEKSGASSVTMPPTTLQACSKQLTLLQTYQTVVELWSKSEQLIERHEVVKEFFASMHSHPLVGYLHLSSPFDHLINYLLNGIRNL